MTGCPTPSSPSMSPNRRPRNPSGARYVAGVVDQLRPAAGFVQPRDARRARGGASPSGRRGAAGAGGDHRLHEAVLDQHRPVQQPHRAKVRAGVHQEAFATAVRQASANGAALPLRDGESVEALLARLDRPFFDRDFQPVVTSKTPGPGRDILEASANNLYVGVAMRDLEGFEERYPLNSRLERRDGGLVEEVYRVNGRYGRRSPGSSAISRPRLPLRRRRWRARSRRWSPSTGRARPRRGAPRHRVGRRPESPVDTINGFIEVYMDARGVKGAWESLVYYVQPRRRPPRFRPSRRTRSGSRIGCRGIRAGASRRSPASRRSAIEVVVETGDSGPVTPIGINLPNDQEIRETLRQQVRLALERQRGLREVDAARVPARVRLERRRGRTRREVGRLRVGADDEPARDHRSRLGPGRRRAQGRAGEVAQGALLGDRGSARRSGGAVFRARSVPRRDRRRCRRRFTTRSSLAEYEAYARNALTQLRRIREGAADRRRPHAQPAVDRALAPRQQRGDPDREARRQDLLPHGRRRGVSRRASAGCSPRSSASRPRATTPPRTSCSRPTACISTPHCATRSSGASTPEPAVLHGLRHAEARAGARRRRQRRRRAGVLSAGSDHADARVFANDRRLTPEAEA